MTDLPSWHLDCLDNLPKQEHEQFNRLVRRHNVVLVERGRAEAVEPPRKPRIGFRVTERK